MARTSDGSSDAPWAVPAISCQATGEKLLDDRAVLQSTSVRRVPVESGQLLEHQLVEADCAGYAIPGQLAVRSTALVWATGDPHEGCVPDLVWAPRFSGCLAT